MPKTRKILTVAGILAAAGALLAVTGFFTGAKSMVSFGENGITIADYSGQAATVQKGIKLDHFTSVDGEVDYANVSFVPSDHFGADVAYYGKKPEITVSGGTLKITQTRKTWGEINLFLRAGNTPKVDTITVYYPEGTQMDCFNMTDENGSLSATGFHVRNMAVTCQYGGLELKNLGTEHLKATLGNGNMKISDSTAGDVQVKNSYGSTSFSSVQISEKMTVSASNGSVNMDGCKVQSLSISDNYGSVSLSSLSAENLNTSLGDGNLEITDSETGNTQVKNSYGSVKTSGLSTSSLNIQCGNGSISLKGRLTGKTVLHSDYGSILVQTSLPKDQYGCDCSTDYGKVTVDGRQYRRGVSILSDAKNSLSVSTGNGDIAVTFSAKTAENSQAERKA